MSEAAFDEIIHAPLRLRICVLLAPVEYAEFAALREDLSVADSVLSKHLKTLVQEGYVSLTKHTGLGGRVRTWAHLTTAGHRALTGHLTALKEMAEAAQRPEGQ